MDFSIKGFKYNKQIIPQVIKKLLESMCLVSHTDLKCRGKQGTECKVSKNMLEFFSQLKIDRNEQHLEKR